MKTPFRTFLMILLLTIVSTAFGQEPPEAPSAKEIKKWILTYVAGASDERAEALQQIQAVPALDKKTVKKWVKETWNATRRLPKANGTMVNSEEFPMTYKIIGKPQRNGPCLIFLHGGGPGGGNDQQWQIAQQKAAAMGFGFAVCPRALSDDSVVAWWEDSEIHALRLLIREIRRTYGVDPNRIFMGGGSMGGWGTVNTGSAMADEFAGLFTVAGTGHDHQLPNLYSTPYTLHIGDQDHVANGIEGARQINEVMTGLGQKNSKAYEWWYKEHKGQGHGLHDPVYVEVAKWLKPRKRNPAPTTIVWRPWKEYIDHMFWLHARAGAGSRGHTGPVVRAEIKKNEIAITNPVPNLTLFLNDDLVNLSEEVIVTVNGEEKFRGTVGYNLSAIVQSIGDREDTSQIYTARIDLD